MAMGWIYAELLHSRGVFRQGHANVLDIGFQQLYSVPREAGFRFVLDNGGHDTKETRDEIASLVLRSPWPSGEGKGVFLHELLALTDLSYISYDIFPGEKIRVFDLNFQAVPEEHREAFDVVLNMGTTEHVFNQYNCFKVIHEATRIGGHMFHQVPTAGYINHGYWAYSPRVFSELAEANGYEVVAAWITGPQGSGYFDERIPGVLWDGSLPENLLAAWQNTPVPNGLINTLLRKTRAGDFRLSLDTTTSAGGADPTVAETYRKI